MPSAAFGSGTPRHRSGNLPIQVTPPPITHSSPVALRAPGLNGKHTGPYASQGCRGRRANFRRRCLVLPQWHSTITSHGVPGHGAPMENGRRHGQAGTMMAGSPIAAQPEATLRDDAEALAPGESAVSPGRSWVRPVAFAVLGISLALLGAVLFAYVRDHRSLEVAPGIAAGRPGLARWHGGPDGARGGGGSSRARHRTLPDLDIGSLVAGVAARAHPGLGSNREPSSGRMPGTVRPSRTRRIWTPISRSTFRRGSTRSSSPPGSWSSRWNS